MADTTTHDRPHDPPDDLSTCLQKAGPFFYGVMFYTDNDSRTALAMVNRSLYGMVIRYRPAFKGCETWLPLVNRQNSQGEQRIFYDSFMVQYERDNIMKGLVYCFGCSQLHDPRPAKRRLASYRRKCASQFLYPESMSDFEMHDKDPLLIYWIYMYKKRIKNWAPIEPEVGLDTTRTWTDGIQFARTARLRDTALINKDGIFLRQIKTYVCRQLRDYETIELCHHAFVDIHPDETCTRNWIVRFAWTTGAPLPTTISLQGNRLKNPDGSMVHSALPYDNLYHCVDCNREWVLSTVSPDDSLPHYGGLQIKVWTCLGREQEVENYQQFLCNLLHPHLRFTHRCMSTVATGVCATAFEGPDYLT